MDENDLAHAHACNLRYIAQAHRYLSAVDTEFLRTLDAERVLSLVRDLEKLYLDEGGGE